MSMEVACAIGDTDPRTKGEGCALIERGADEVEHRHRVCLAIIDDYPYLVRQLLVFYCQAH
jgi:hypothetical protein